MALRFSGVVSGGSSVFNQKKAHTLKHRSRGKTSSLVCMLCLRSGLAGINYALLGFTLPGWEAVSFEHHHQMVRQ